MEPIDELGLFWRAGEPDNHLSGRLVYDPADSIRLSLVGELDDRRAHEPARDIRLHGWIGSQPVTLEHAFTAGSSFVSRGVSAIDYGINGLFLGHHVDEAPARFGSLHLEISDLSNWVGLKGAEETFDWQRSGNGPLYSFSYTPTENPVAEFDRGTIELRTQWRQGSQQPDMIGFRTWAAFGLTYREPQTFADIMRDAKWISDLVELCIDTATHIEKIYVQRDDIRDTTLDGVTDAGQRLIEYRSLSNNYVPPTARKPREWHQMLLTFDQIGGISAVAKWLDLVPGFELSLASMMSINARQMFMENRFLNVVNGAEAFHRLTIGGGQFPTDEFDMMVEEVVAAAPEQNREWLARRLEFANEPTLTKRMKDLAKTAGPAAKPLIGDRTRWAFAISATRNILTHVGGGSDFSGSDIRYLTDSVFAVTRICMLLHLGIPMATLESVADSRNMLWYRDSLHDAIGRARTVDAERRVPASGTPDVFSPVETTVRSDVGLDPSSGEPAP